MVPGPYEIPHVSITIDQAFTHTTPTDAYRGAGRPEATHGLERLMDEIADELGLDPAEVRRRELHQRVPPHHRRPACRTTPATTQARSTARSSCPSTRASSRAAPRRASRGRYRGIGLSTYVEVCGLAPSAVTKAIGISAPGWESSTVRMHPFGKVTVITGSSPHGQGHATSWSQIIADRARRAVRGRRGHPRRHRVRAVRPRHVRLRSLAVAGTALYRSIEKVQGQGARRSPRTSSSARSTTWSGPTAAGSVKGSPGVAAARSRSSARPPGSAATLPEGLEPGMEATTFHDPPNFTFPFGTHVCEVEIDPETGRVEVVNYVAVDDCGNVINPMIVDGQVHGGVDPVDRAGALRGDGLRRGRPAADADARRVPDAVGRRPAVDHLDRTVTPTPVNPLGAKGIGEAGTIAATPGRRQRRRRRALGARHPPPRDADAAGTASGTPSAPRREAGSDPARAQLHEGALARRGARRLRDGAKPIAGGQSLVPMMRLRLAAPDGARRRRRHRRARRHPPRGRRDRDRRHDPAPRHRRARTTSSGGCPRRRRGRGRHRLARRPQPRHDRRLARPRRPARRPAGRPARASTAR